MQTNIFLYKLVCAVRASRRGNSGGTVYLILMGLEESMFIHLALIYKLLVQSYTPIAKPANTATVSHRRLGLYALSMGWCCANVSPLQARLGSAVVLCVATDSDERYEMNGLSFVKCF